VAKPIVSQPNQNTPLNRPIRSRERHHIAGKTRAASDAITELAVTDARESFPGFYPAEYMPLDYAVYILNDMTYGQLDNFDPPDFVLLPQPAIELTSAAMTLCWAIGERGFVPSTNSMMAMWYVIGALKELNESVPSASSYIYHWLINEVAPPLYRTGSQNNRERRAKTKKAGFVYVVRGERGAYKIGYSVDPNNRIRTFGVKLPFEVKYEVLIKTDDMRDLEAELHDRFAEKTINGEWFALDADDLAELRAMGGAE
jgi:mRNA-degrading endonuclease RelE of RelBE toxin-antitoxin system